VPTLRNQQHYGTSPPLGELKQLSQAELQRLVDFSVT